MSTQQDIYAAGSESRPPMLNKENFVPWSSCLLRNAKSRLNGKLIHNSIINGPYVRRMIPEPGDINRNVPVNETFHEKKAKLFNEWERFTSNEGESIESYYHHFLKLMNDLKRNKYFPEKIASNLNIQAKLLNTNQQQPEDFIKSKEYADCSIGYDYGLRQTNADGWRNQVVQNTVQNPRVQNIGNQNGLIGVPGNANQNLNGNGNLVAARAEVNAIRQNGNQIRYYNCTGVGHFARNCTVRPRRRDAAYLQTQLLIAQKEEQASTSVTQSDKAPVYDSDGSAEVIHICLWCIDSGCSKHMTGNLKLLINFVWKFIGTVRFRNDHVAAILGFGDLQWGNVLITRVYFVKGLGHNLFSVGDCSTNLYTINLHEMDSASPICLMARASSTKSSKVKYHKEHLCPSCEQGKSKRASHPPKPVPNSRQRLHLLHMDLCGPMRIASINEAARTMLIFSRAPLFLWAEAIATVCFTQNCSIIHRRFNKTPYELINGSKPDISFLHVFGALYYPKNDREDIGKLGAKGDIGFFIGYSANSRAYRIFNRRTKKIMETMNVSFDNLSAMAFEQHSLKPGLQSMTSGHISSGLDLTYALSTITTQQPSKGELDLLFEAMYDDYIGGQPSATARTALPTQEP
nr:retrovirus-related Pol polyprotein from transposon TNT 1-94 [Tanacetum cinerariifolium]